MEFRRRQSHVARDPAIQRGRTGRPVTEWNNENKFKPTPFQYITSAERSLLLSGWAQRSHCVRNCSLAIIVLRRKATRQHLSPSVSRLTKFQRQIIPYEQKSTGKFTCEYSLNQWLTTSVTWRRFSSPKNCIFESRQKLRRDFRDLLFQGNWPAIKKLLSETPCR